MPATIRVANHDANLIYNPQGVDSRGTLLDALHGAGNHGDILQSSLDGNNLPPVLLAHKNGFVDAVTTAYSRHHHLTLRPEDVWLAIISQFSLYVNRNAEKLRGKFVAHEGQKELQIVYEHATRYTVDFADFAQQISGLISESVVDDEICRWITPNFSTTTGDDIVDYEDILRRLDKLAHYGKEPDALSDLLRPILRCFIRSFDDPEHPDVRSFWGKICDAHSGSGFNCYSGWITAFCFWNGQGERQVFPNDPEARHIETMTGCRVEKDYGLVEMSDVPAGFTRVPVRLIDNGVELEAEMIAGSVGVNCTSSGKPSADGTAGLDTMQNHLDWFMYEKP
ncbi:hypothetical protein PG985_011266 [Apiospora marii]|uniref:DUF4419 domain-containing protein n=1 Tax=Apiospora marii TaxID=335849 RepID=A0ABR1SUZ7_9PEZI